MADRKMRYIQFLPAVYQPRGAGAGADAAFLDAYLGILQDLLDRTPDSASANDATTHTLNRRGMANVIDILPQLFYPQLAFLFPGDQTFIPPFQPPQSQTGYTDEKFDQLNDYFGISNPTVTGAEWQTQVDTDVTTWLNGLLDWQAGWVGLAPDAKWTVDNRRQILATILPVYRQRGTAEGLTSLLEIFIGGEFIVSDVSDAPALTVGYSTVLKPDYADGDGVLGAVRPFSFEVVLVVPTYDMTSPDIQAKVALVRALVDREKPAHTNYTVGFKTTVATLGSYSHVGVDFLLPMEGTGSSA